jgi:two-component system, chemotaxis family, protein-glutamate methylesterase/glutaminase
VPKIRVLVVEDSITVRRRLCDVLSSDPEFVVLAEAGDGKTAIHLCEKHRPDLITMDMMLPVMTGLSATEYIMAHCPTPILVVSASTNRGDLFKTYDALAAGAVDVLDKPNGNEPDGVWEARFLATAKLVSRIRVITHPRARLAAFGRPLPTGLLPLPERSSPQDAREQVSEWPIDGTEGADERTFRLAAIGASTGGPGAIVEILRMLPSEFQMPMVFVLHINEPFGSAFAAWLDGQSSRRVGYAEDGAPIASATGKLLMAPPDWHLVLQHGRFRLSQEAERHSCRPSVDVLFDSLARELGPSVVACLLTGMGKDGAAGLLEIRRAGGLTIGQDEESSVIYGMPREAALLGAVSRVLPLSAIGRVLGSLSHVRDP